MGQYEDRIRILDQQITELRASYELKITQLNQTHILMIEKNSAEIRSKYDLEKQASLRDGTIEFERKQEQYEECIRALEQQITELRASYELKITQLNQTHMLTIEKNSAELRSQYDLEKQASLRDGTIEFEKKQEQYEDRIRILEQQISELRTSY